MMLLGALSALLIAALLATATCGWLLAGQVFWRARHARRPSLAAQAALWRHPAGRARDNRAEPGPLDPPAQADAPPGSQWPAGPEDDPEFIRALERLIRGSGPDPTI